MTRRPGLTGADYPIAAHLPGGLDSVIERGHREIATSQDGEMALKRNLTPVLEWVMDAIQANHTGAVSQHDRDAVMAGLVAAAELGASAEAEEATRHASSSGEVGEVFRGIPDEDLAGRHTQPQAVPNAQEGGA
jgi:hypothetical protein